VTVATYGPTTDFPAFYSQKSGFQSPWSVDSLGEAAKLIRELSNPPSHVDRFD
jgi:pseudouridine-5'-phosphate glycosidase